MSSDKNISPTGWYVGSYLIRFVELKDEGNEDPEGRFLVWENTVIVQASNLDEAYEKIVAQAQLGTKPYKGGRAGVPVRWVFEGLTELLPIYEDFEDGSEIMYREHTRKKLKTLRKAAKTKDAFRQ